MTYCVLRTIWIIGPSSIFKDNTICIQYLRFHLGYNCIDDTLITYSVVALSYTLTYSIFILSVFRVSNDYGKYLQVKGYQLSPKRREEIKMERKKCQCTPRPNGPKLVCRYHELEILIGWFFCNMNVYLILSEKSILFQNGKHCWLAIYTVKIRSS